MYWAKKAAEGYSTNEKAPREAQNKQDNACSSSEAWAKAGQCGIA